MKRRTVYVIPVLLASLGLIAGCTRQAAPQNAQEAKARFTAHPQTSDLSPKAQEMVQAMRNRGSSPARQ